MEPAYYCVDVETTGPDLKNDRIIQLAFLKVQGDTIEAYNDLCYTDIEMNDVVTAIHGITNAMLEDKYWPDETDAFMELEKGNRPENYFVSHGNKMDITMLEHEGLHLRMKPIDTDKCARALLKEAPSYKLGELVQWYGLEERARKVAQKIGLEDIEAHDALTDAMWHYVLFTFLLEEVGNDPDKLVEMTAKPMMLEKITFGKFKGKSFQEVFEKEPEALVWMYANMTKDWPDLEYTLAHWLKQKEYFWKKAQKEKEEVESRIF